MVIDVSVPPDSETLTQTQLVAEYRKSQPGLHPVASMDDRRLAALIDLGCFAVCIRWIPDALRLTRRTIYAEQTECGCVRYHFGHRVSAILRPLHHLRRHNSGHDDARLAGRQLFWRTAHPRQMLLRSAGYMLSAGTFFLGFLWAMWDEDELTWPTIASRAPIECSGKLLPISKIPSVAHSR